MKPAAANAFEPFLCASGYPLLLLRFTVSSSLYPWLTILLPEVNNHLPYVSRLRKPQLQMSGPSLLGQAPVSPSNHKRLRIHCCELCYIEGYDDYCR